GRRPSRARSRVSRSYDARPAVRTAARARGRSKVPAQALALPSTSSPQVMPRGETRLPPLVERLLPWHYHFHYPHGTDCTAKVPLIDFMPPGVFTSRLIVPDTVMSPSEPA